VKLQEALRLGKACGLTTLGECFENVRLHSMNLFNYHKIGDELSELVDELTEKKLKPTEKIDLVVDKLGLEWYYKTEEDEKYGAPSLKKKGEICEKRTT